MIALEEMKIYDENFLLFDLAKDGHALGNKRKGNHSAYIMSGRH